MNRRAFLELLGLTTVAAATPRFIFDMGKNLYKSNRQILITHLPMTGSVGGISRTPYKFFKAKDLDPLLIDCGWRYIPNPINILVP